MWIYMAHKSTLDKALKAHYKQNLNYNIAYKIKLNLLLLLLLKHLYSAPRRTERFTKEKEWKIENKNYGNKWVFSCLLNIGKDCDSHR